MKTLIKGGWIVDGTGRDAFSGDVLIEDDCIVSLIPTSLSIPNFLSPSARAVSTCPPSVDRVVNAKGCLVTPGFVDAHAHSDAYLVIEPDAPSKISQGITTEVNGQCGGSVAPRYGAARLSSDWASVLGERLTWRSLAEYRTVLEASRPALNTVQFVGHNTLRSSAMGYVGRTATADDLRAMTRLLEESMDAGAWGLTTGLIYQPGRYATSEEVVTLAQVAARHGGFYATHMRSEGDNILDAIDEVLALVRTTGIRAEISHLKTSGARNWGKIDAVLAKMQAAVDAGELLGSDRYPYCAAGTDLDIVLPDWAQEGAAKAECERLADAALRARIVAEIDASDRDWSSVMIGGTWSDETKPFSGKRVAEILADPTVFGLPPTISPGALVCRILAADQCRTGAFFFGMSEANLDAIYRCDWVVPGSDASLRAPWGVLGQDHPHPRAYGTMPEFYRRVRALGFSREETIARMTAVPARRFGLRGRGVLAAGAFADIAVWDEAGFQATGTYDAPHQFAAGMRHVFVNGALTYSEGCFTGNRAGRFLER